MRGLPGHFGTKADIPICIDEDPAGTKVMLQSLLDHRYGWVPERDLPPGDPGRDDETHQTRAEPVDPNADLMATHDVAMKQVQYVRQEDPFAELPRLGLTVSEVHRYMAECDRRAR